VLRVLHQAGDNILISFLDLDGFHTGDPPPIILPGLSRFVFILAEYNKLDGPKNAENCFTSESYLPF
jgi:hypothetical protein